MKEPFGLLVIKVERLWRGGKNELLSLSLSRSLVSSLVPRIDCGEITRRGKGGSEEKGNEGKGDERQAI